MKIPFVIIPDILGSYSHNLKQAKQSDGVCNERQKTNNSQRRFDEC